MFRIQFYDGKIKVMTLLENILLDDKFKGIPKLVVTQFCRGKSMFSTMKFDSTPSGTSGLTKNVNGQEFYSKFDSVFSHGSKQKLKK